MKNFYILFIISKKKPLSIQEKKYNVNIPGDLHEEKEAK